MEIRKRLLVVGLILLAAGLACALPPPETSDNTLEIADAYIDYQSCVDNWFSLSEDDPYRGCAQELSEISPEKLVLVSQHTECQTDKNSLCAAAINAMIDAELEELLCEGLTPEECANAGTHGYEGTVTANLDLCGIPPINPLEYWNFSFADGQVQFERFSATSFDGYAGHTRVAANTYEFGYSDGLATNRLTFTENGFIEESIFDAGCILTTTYIFSE